MCSNSISSVHKLSTCLDDSMLVALFHCREGRAFHWIMVIFPHPLSQLWWSENFESLPVFSVLRKGGVSLVEWFKFQLPWGEWKLLPLVDEQTVIFHFDASFRITWKSHFNCEKILRLLDLDYDFSVDETKELIKRDYKYRKNGLT